MIAKAFIASIDYDVKTDRILSEWVPSGRNVPVWTKVEGLKESIGFLTPVKFWRKSLHSKAGDATKEMIILCFHVKHIFDPGVKIGDLCGVGHAIRLEIGHNGVMSVLVEKL